MAYLITIYDMNINKIQLKNFKGYSDIELNFSKITFLTGANSSGKSSLIYSVLGAIQSGEFPIHFSPNGKYVNMGDFGEMVNNHDINKKISLNFFISNPENISIYTEWKNDEVRKLPTLSKMFAESEFFKLKIEKIRKYSLEFEYFPELDNNSHLRSPELYREIMTTITNSLKKLRKDDNDEEFVSKRKVEINNYYTLNNTIKFKFENFDNLNLIRQKKGNYIFDIIFKDIKESFREYDRKVSYISSFRLFPERTYYETSKSDLRVGKFGENYEDQIILWETNKDPKFKELCGTLLELGLLHDIKSKRLDGGRYEILVQSIEFGTWSSITDVGFGISQFLPIIVADLQLPEESTLYIAQPEIHLHPKIQALFGDYIVKQITEKSKKYVIETHSEYLINRIRLCICKDQIKENDISTIYLENFKDSTKSHIIKFNSSGEIKNAPPSFFETYMIDVMDIAMNAQI